MKYCGLPMHGLKAASGKTKDYKGTGVFVEVYYNTGSGDITTKTWKFDPGEYSHTIFGDERIIRVVRTDEHIRMDDLAHAIKWAVDHMGKKKEQI